jgi:hypothetical protein
MTHLWHGPFCFRLPRRTCIMGRMFGSFRLSFAKIPAQSSAWRAPLFACLILAALAGATLVAPVQASDGPNRPLWQDSPLSPLAAPVTSMPPEPAATPPISLVLVGIVLVGVLFVVGLVSWRR